MYCRRLGAQICWEIERCKFTDNDQPIEPSTHEREEEGANAHDEDENEENEEEDDIGEERIQESNFKFEDFSKRLAHPKIVRACGLALRNFEKNSVTTNHCIIKLLHRIAWDCKMAAMIFQVSIFRSFQKIFEMKDLPQFKELVKFASYIIREFTKVSEKNSKIFFEALFWKSSREAYDVEEGYGSYHKKSEAANKAWTELEEDELRTLYIEYQEKLIQEDVVDWILNNLIDNTRTRRGVLKKLKEMYLLTDYKGRSRPNNNTRAPAHWSEQEELQLRELYEQFKGAMDPLGCIMDRLDVKRPKNRIVEKLLVMGLVQDKKELRKKRSGKTRRGNEPDGNSSDSLDSDSDVDIEASRTASSSNNLQNGRDKHAKAGGGGGRTSRRPPKDAERRKKSSRQFLLSKNELSKLLIAIVNSGMSDALEWLRESFSDAADDMEADPETDETGIPLVPILDCSVTAMEDTQFQRLLLAFGIARPADEQESYWRIPDSLKANTLKEHCDLISQAVDGTLEVETENSENQEAEINPQSEASNNQARDDSSDDEYVFGNLRKNVNNANSEDKNHEVDIQMEEASTSNPINQKEATPARKTKIVALESSDDDSDKENAAIQEEPVGEADEDDNLGKRHRLSSDSDSEKPVQKKSRRLIVDSDDED
ncbi:putative tmeless protein [Trypoxylus dichotomus]